MAQYSTGEVAKLCGVTVRTVQYYDERGLVKPSTTTEGGRRSYSEADLSKMRIVCFLKSLSFSLKDIKKMLDEPDRDNVIEILADEQLSSLNHEIETRQDQISRLKELKSSLKVLKPIPDKSLEAIAAVMDGRKKLRNLRILVIIVGVIMDVCWIGGLLLWIFQGIWWMFVTGLLIAAVLGVVVSRYYISHTAFICSNGHTVFRPPMLQVFFTPHTPTTRKLRCPSCGHRVNCVEIYAPSTEPTRVGKDLIWKS